MKISISYPPIGNSKGVPLLAQNRQFQWFNSPTFIYPMIPAYAATLLKEKDYEVFWDDGIAESLSYAEWEKRIVKEKPDIIEVLSDKEKKEKKAEDIELRLHESLLPVKDEKDKKLVKEYFSKIFSVLSKDLRVHISNLKISKKEKRELLEELAFLTKEEQIKYIEVLVDLYKEIPKKLIARIRKLPNVNPKHMDKIVEQLRVMDFEEQLKFVQFLEENA